MHNINDSNDLRMKRIIFTIHLYFSSGNSTSVTFFKRNKEFGLSRIVFLY